MAKVKINPEYAALLPPLTTEEFAALKADIKLRGVLSPLLTDEEGYLLDGHHRFQIDKGAPIKVIKGLSPAQKLAFVSACNFRRRNLSPEQKREHRDEQKKIAVLLREENKKLWTQAKVAAELGVAQNTVSTWFTTNINNDNGCKPKPDARKVLSVEAKETIADRVESGETQAQVAADFGVSQQAVGKVVGQEKKKRQKKKEAAKKVIAPSSDISDWSIVNGDCIEELAKIAAGSASLVFADPPYNIGVNYGSGKKADQLPSEKFLEWSTAWIHAAVKTLSVDGSIWVMIGDEYAAELCLTLKEEGLHMRNWIKWYETFGNNCTGKFNRCSRHILYFTKSPKKFCFNGESVSRPSDRQTVYNDHRANHHGKLWDDVWWIPRLVGTSKERIPDYPTQLPLELVRAVIGCASDPGDLVIDPFTGTGTTGVACIESGRRFYGIEKGKKWHAMAKRRLASTTHVSSAD